MSRSFYEFGQCKPGAGNLIVQASGYGPVVAICQQFDQVDFCLSFIKKDSDGNFTTPLATSIAGTAQETATANEDTTYDGDGSTLTFSGASLANVAAARPAIPGSIHVLTDGVNAPALKDLYKNGILYSVDSDLEASGTINYQTGAIALSYGTGKAPKNLYDILVNYSISRWRTVFGSHIYSFGGPVRDDIIEVIGMSKASGLLSCRLGVEVIFGG